MGERPLDYSLPLGQLFNAEQVFGPAAPQAAPLPAAQPGLEQASGLDIARILGMADQQQEAVNAESRAGQLAIDRNGDGVDDGPALPLELGYEAARDFLAPSPEPQAQQAGPSAWDYLWMRPSESVQAVSGSPEQAQENAETRQGRNDIWGQDYGEERPLTASGDLAGDEWASQQVPVEEGGVALQRQTAEQGGALSNFRPVQPPEGTLAPNGRPAVVGFITEGMTEPLYVSDAGATSFHGLLSEVQQYVYRGEDAGRLRGGANPALPSGSIERLTAAHAAWLNSMRGVAPGGPGRPQQAASFGLRAGGAVGAETQGTLDAMPGALAGVDAAGIQAEQNVNAGEQARLQAMSEMQGRLAQEAQARAAAVAQRSQERLAALDQTLNDVAAMRVDPNAFYGGQAGRVTATIAVALGQLGSILTGGPNVALETINAGIERSMQAQQANIQNARQGAQQQANALDQFRSILGDEEAAQSAARAAMLTAYETQLGSIMQGLRGPQLQAASQLQALLRQQALAERQATRDREAYTSSIAMQGAPQDVVQLMQGSQAFLPQAQQPQVQAQPVQEALPPTPTVEEGLAEGPVAQRPRPRRTAPNAQGQVRSPAARPASARGLESPEDYQEDRAAWLRDNQESAGTPDGLMLGGTINHAALWNAIRSGAAPGPVQEVYIQAQREFSRIQRVAPRVLAIRRRSGGELTNINRDVVRANALLNNIRDQYRIVLTGAAAPPEEIERLFESIPEVNEQNVANIAGIYDDVLTRLEGYFLTRMGDIEDDLNNFAGLVPRTDRGQAYWATAIQQQASAERPPDTRRRPSAQETARTRESTLRQVYGRDPRPPAALPEPR